MPAGMGAYPLIANPNTISVRVSKFQPSDISGLLIWMRADELGLSDAAAVSTWTNGGSGLNFTQATGANQPTFRIAVQNGLGIIRFDGINDLLSSAAMSLAQPCTTYWVASRTGNTTAYNVGLTQATEAIAFGFKNEANLWYAYTNPALTTQAAADSAFHIMTCNYNGASSTMRVDGTAAAVALDAGDVSNDTFHIGATSAAGAPLAGDIGEILVYTGAHTAAQITSVEQHLSAKWAITLA